MLIVPNFENLATWAAQQGIPATDGPALVAMPQVQQMVEREIQALLRDLAGYEMPKKFLLLPRDFSIESGGADAQAQHQAAGGRAAERSGDRGTLRGSHHRLAPTQTPSALASSSIKSGEGSLPSPTTRSPGSTTLAASLIQCGSSANGRPSTTRASSRT